MISKTKIDKKMRKKTNAELVELIKNLKKKKSWIGVANLLSNPQRKKLEKNLDEINTEEHKAEEVIVVAGKVLGRGEVSKKIKIAAYSFSQEALRKLKEKKCEVFLISEEFKKNPEGRGLKIIK